MEPPVFASIDSYGARLGDVGYWRPYAEAALASSGLPEQTMQSGFEGTYPTLVGGQLVVKLFGYFPGWRESVAAETAANRAIERIDGISAFHRAVVQLMRECSDFNTPFQSSRTSTNES